MPLLILRLAGIYGPGRSAFDKLRDGTARRIVKPDQVFNRIHVDDIGRVTMLAARAKLAGTFNLADDEPAPPQDLVTYAAGISACQPPPDIPFERAEMTEMARSFYSDNKRVSNKAIKAALGIELLYPTYREGLDAIHGSIVTETPAAGEVRTAAHRARGPLHAARADRPRSTPAICARLMQTDDGRERFATS